MSWVRKAFGGFLSVVLLVSLLGGALATSSQMNLTHPAKIETWLGQSRLYDHFVDSIIDQANKSSVARQVGSVSLNDAAVQKAAKSAFPPRLLKQSVHTFLQSNYAWLEGKTATPDFKIDLSAAKQSFAEQVGQYVRIYATSLPVCTAPQLAALLSQPVDPLTATCRPPTITPEAAGATVTEQLSTSGDFLSNPILTARTINPKDDKGGSQPYYEKLDRLPQAYQLAAKLPWIFAAAAILSGLGVVFLAKRKRIGLRRVAILLMLSGLVLVTIKFVADFGFHRVEHKVFNTANNGPLQQSLTDFAHRVESALVKTDLLFGIAFVVLALAAFFILFRTRRPPDNSAKDSLNQVDGPLSPLPPKVASSPSRPVKGTELAPTPKRPTTKRPRPPRLIQ